MNNLVSRQLYYCYYISEVLMRLNVHYVLTWILLGCCLNACQDRSAFPPIGPVELNNCFHKTTWNEESIRDALLGRWEWNYISCWTPDIDHYGYYSGLTIEFRSDSTLTVFEKDTIIQNSVWHVIEHDAYDYYLDVEPFHSSLEGILSICDEWVVFNNSATDLCINYFRKK